MLKVLDQAREDNVEGAEGAVPTLDEVAREGRGACWRRPWWRRSSSTSTRIADARDATGRRLVVRNGRAQSRAVTCGAGTLRVRAPRVNDRRVGDDGERPRFTSRILPPYMRRSPQVAEVLPVAYRRGLSTGDFREALPVLLGEDAAGLSATNITRLTAAWDEEYQAFRRRDLSACDFIYVWVDGIRFNIRLEDDRPVHAGDDRVRSDGNERAGGDRGRLSGECGEMVERAAGPTSARTAGAGDGGRRRRAPQCATSGRRRLRNATGATRRPTCSTKLPKRLRSRAKRALREIMYAATRADAETAIGAFVAEFEAKYPKATGCLVEDQEALLAFFAMPAEHWLHLRTSNLIESPFATVRLRQRVRKGAGSRTKGLLMAYKLWRWRSDGGVDWCVSAYRSSMAYQRTAVRRKRRLGKKPPESRQVPIHNT